MKFNNLVCQGNKCYNNVINPITNEHLDDLTYWNKTGEITVAKSGNVNTVEFSNAPAIDPFDKLIADIQTRYGVTFSSSNKASIISNWLKENYVAFVRPLSSTRVQLFIGQYVSADNTAIVVDPTVYLYYSDGTYNSNNNRVTSDYASYPTQHYYGSISQFGEVPTYQDFNSKFKAIYNIDTPYTCYRAVMAAWLNDPTLKLATSTLGNSTYFYYFLGNNISSDGSTVSINTTYTAYRNDSSGSPDSSITSNYSYAVGVNGTYYYGNYSDFASDGGGDLQYEISLSADTKYLLKFNGNTSGFTQGSNEIISIDNGAVIVTESFNNTNTLTDVEYKIVFEGSNTTTLKFNFNGITYICCSIL